MSCLQKVLSFGVCKGPRDVENQSRGSKASDVIKDSIGFLFQVSTVTQWNSVYDAVERLNAIFDDQGNSKALN